LVDFTGCLAAVNFTEVRGGMALTSSKYFNAQTVSLRNGGQLFLTGTGFSGIDVARTLYTTDKTANGRDTPSLLQNPPLVYATTKALRIYNGTLAVASLLTDFNSQYLLWQVRRRSVLDNVSIPSYSSNREGLSRVSSYGRWRLLVVSNH
jgi:hypothetical protein